jgi:DNA-binding transcriptional MerR regulator
MIKILFHQDVHEMTGVPIATLRYWRQVGKGPKSFRIENRVAYKLEDVEKWLDELYAADPHAGGDAA